MDDTVNILHYILQHVDKPRNYARILFVDFSSAFNTILPDLLSDKLTQLSVPTSICQWITNFLTDRQQLVRLGKLTSITLTISTGKPQGCVSPHCSSPSTQMMHFKGPLCQAPEVCGELRMTLQSSASSGRRRVCLQTGCGAAGLSSAVLTTWS